MEIDRGRRGLPAKPPIGQPILGAHGIPHLVDRRIYLARPDHAATFDVLTGVLLDTHSVSPWLFGRRRCRWFVSVRRVGSATRHEKKRKHENGKQ